MYDTYNELRDASCTMQLLGKDITTPLALAKDIVTVRNKDHQLYTNKLHFIRFYKRAYSGNNPGKPLLQGRKPGSTLTTAQKAHNSNCLVHQYFC